MGSENQDQTKKYFCAKCFMPIDSNDKVEIDGQNFHRNCSMCCVCHNIPSTLKMFYGQVFCNECFKSHILNRFRGECPKVQSNGWWMQWGPYCYSHWQYANAKANGEDEKSAAGDEASLPQDQAKKCICIRCLQSVDEKNKIVIEGQNFHTQCAKCCMCQTVPKSLKIYYGQVFCEECFHRNVLNSTRDGPSEFFKTCFDQWQCNPQFNENMNQFMASGSGVTSPPPVFIIPGGPSPFCRCGGNAQEWYGTEAKKSVTSALQLPLQAEPIIDTPADYHTEVSDCNSRSSTNTKQFLANHDDSIENPALGALEKIEKLTKLLHYGNHSKSYRKKWNIFNEKPKIKVQSRRPAWAGVKSQVIKGSLKCPKCLWQCGPIYVRNVLK